jgi:hypothetical protein
MSTLHYHVDPKQLAARDEYEADRAKSKMDSAIDAEEARQELIDARAQEIELPRMAAKSAADVIGGLNSAIEGAAGKAISEALLTNNYELIGKYVEALVVGYIQDDSNDMAVEWMERIERESML